MFSRCLICSAPFEANETLEHLPLGGRIAYDPGRGRLWVVCRSCRRWSLTPLEARWEAVEELERLARDRARLLSRTDNIALLRSGRLEVVRVGSSNLTEEAWWRYGRELRDRRATARKLSAAGTVATGAVMVGGWASGGISLIGMWFLLSQLPDSFTNAARWLRFGGTAWRGRGSCTRCGRRFGSLGYRERGALYLLPESETGTSALAVRCPDCGEEPDSGLILGGAEADRTLRRVLAYQHFEGASERRVRSAARLIEEAGSPRALRRIVVKGGRPLADVRRTGAIALEIAASEAAERRLLALELAALERHWRREEELAAIADGELTPVPALEALRRRLASRS